MTGPCFHQRTSRGRVYEGCLDCGAVRVLEQADGRGEWHSCERCYYGPATPHPAPARSAALGAMLTDCCGAPVDQGGGGAHQGFCQECAEELCSACAGVFESEGGYGDDGQGVHTRSICASCFAEIEEKRQRREARNDSGV